MLYKTTTLAKFSRKINIILISTHHTRFSLRVISLLSVVSLASFFHLNMLRSALTFLLVCLIAFYFSPYQFVPRFWNGLESNVGQGEDRFSSFSSTIGCSPPCCMYSNGSCICPPKKEKQRLVFFFLLS